MAAKKPPVSEWEAKRDKERAEYLTLAEWYTDACDSAILDATQDFASSAKAASYARQVAKKSDPRKFQRLRELELQVWRWVL